MCLGAPDKRSSGKCVRRHLEHRWIPFYFSRNLRHQVNDVGIKLNLFEYLNGNLIRIATHIISRKVYEHHVLRILLSHRPQVSLQSRHLPDHCLTFWMFQRLDKYGRYYYLPGVGASGEEPKQLETSIIKIEKIGWWIYWTKRAVHVKLIAPEGGRKPPRQYDLKNISAKAMLFSLINYTFKNSLNLWN